MHSRMAPYNCLLSYLLRHFDCNLAWNTCRDWDCCWCISMQLFIFFNLRPSGVSLCSASNPQARTGTRMWRAVMPTCVEICLGWIACLSCWPRQMSSLPTSRHSWQSTSADTFVNSKMPTLRGVLAALDSFSHCAHVWIWIDCWRKTSLSTLQVIDILQNPCHVAQVWPLDPLSNHGTTVEAAPKARDLSLLLLWN